MRAGGDDLPYAVEGQVGCAVVQDLGDHLEVLGTGQRADREEAVVAARREDVPVVAVQAGDTDVGDQDRVRVDGLAGHADAEPAPDHRTTAVGGHDVPGADGGAGREPDRHTVLVLGEAGDLAVEGHPAAQLVEPGPQDLLGAPLRHHPRGAVRRVLGGLGRVEHALLGDPFAVLPDHPDRVLTTRREDRVQDAEVVEDLHRARLDPLAARAGESPGPRSTISASTPRRARSTPRASPVGPAPTISTSTCSVMTQSP